MDQRTIEVINEECGDWELVTSIHLIQNHTDWVLMRRKKESSGWQNFRLCLLGTQRKRTYRLGWSPTEGRFAANADSHLLQKELPGLKILLRRHLLESSKALQDAAARDVRVSSASSALERLRSSNPFDRAPSTDSRMRYFFFHKKITQPITQAQIII